MTWFECNPQDQTLMAQPTVDTASGSIATFDTDMTENLVEVLCNITPVQTGSGTPSPSNPRPITTYTEMNVTATGKNLAQLFVDGKVPSISTGALVNSPGARSDFIRVEPNTDYTLSVSNSQQIYVFFYEENTASTYISYQSTLGGVTSLTVTIPNNCNYVMLRTASNDYTGGQFEKGDTATTYEPFNGTTANIPFGQTVAQGVLNVGTGKLRVTHDIYTFTGAEGWTLQQPTQNKYYSNNYVLRDLALRPEDNNHSVPILTSIGSFNIAYNNLQNYENSICIAADRRIGITPDLYTGSGTLQGEEILYEKETPIEIQLDSITLQALLNENNIWCDTGDTEVKYLLTVGKKIA